MAQIKFNRNLTQAEALQGNADTIYFTTDTQCLIMGGKIYGLGPSRLFIGTQEEYDAAAKFIPVGTIVIIEDGALSAGDTAILGTAILGKMILGKE